MKLPVKTLWQGKVAVRDKFIHEAFQNKEQVVITHNGQRMVLNWDKLKEKLVGKSDKPFKDEFSKEKHYLYYYWWRPDKNELVQRTLF